jgi:hypothetical protein
LQGELLPVPPSPHGATLFFRFFLRALGDVSPEQDDGNEKNDDYDILDVVCLEEVYIAVKITHQSTSL